MIAMTVGAVVGCSDGYRAVRWLITTASAPRSCRRRQLGSTMRALAVVSRYSVLRRKWCEPPLCQICGMELAPTHRNPPTNVHIARRLGRLLY